MKNRGAIYYIRGIIADKMDCKDFLIPARRKREKELEERREENRRKKEHKEYLRLKKKYE